MTNPKLSGINKIAVLRANAIGDFVFTLPALHALRAAYPEAEIVILGQPWHERFLTGRPGPWDRAVVIPRVPGVREDRGAPGVGDPAQIVDGFFGRMQEEDFDLALQLYGGGQNSNPFTLRLGARHTAGLKTPDAAALERWIPYIYFQSEVMRLLEVVALVGAAPVELNPRLAVTDRDLEEACGLVSDNGRPIAIVHPGVGDGRRRWPAEKFAAVGDALAEAGAEVIVTGIPEERPLVDTVIRTMRAPARDLCGRISLNGMAGLLSRARVVVGNDSGMVHLGEAVGAATVGIYWCGNLINAGPLTRTRHRVHLSWRLNCITCGRNCIDDNCEHHDTFVGDVPVEEVAGSALELLNG